MEKSHVIWNRNHPSNSVKKGEVIHHRDGNHDNDVPKNQQKMLKAEHSSFHLMKRGLHLNQCGEGNGFFGKSHSEESNEMTKYECIDCGVFVTIYEAYQVVMKFSWIKRLVFGKRYIIYKPLCWVCFIVRTGKHKERRKDEL